MKWWRVLISKITGRPVVGILNPKGDLVYKLARRTHLHWVVDEGPFWMFTEILEPDGRVKFRLDQCEWRLICGEMPAIDTSWRKQ